MPRLFSGDQEITPDRAVRVVFDPDETICSVPAWGFCRDAAETAKASQVGLGSSTNVDLISGTWQLKTIQANISNINENTEFQDLVIPPTDFNYAVPFGNVNCPVSSYNNFRAPTDITGVTALPTTQPTGDTFTRREIIAGVDQSIYELTNDVNQLPKPPPCIGTNIPVDRFAVGTVTYPENCGFHLRFAVPGTHFHSPDVIWAFYFGGRPNESDNPVRGYCLVFYGNGDAELWEDTTIFQIGPVGGWQVRTRFSYCPPNQVAGYVHGITIQPHGRNTISFRIVSASRAISHGRSSTEAPLYAGTPPTTHAAKFEANALVSLWDPGKVVTGAGNLRIDMRRDLLLCYQISILDYQATGILVDHEFIIPFPTPIGTVATLALNAVIPEGCSINPFLFDAKDTNMTSPAPATYVGGSIYQFSLGFNTRAYFLAFALTGNSAKRSTPQIKRFSLKIPATFATRQGLNVVAPVDQTDEVGITVTGFDGDPTHETATVRIINLDGKLTLPRQRGRIQTRIELNYVEGSEVKTCAVFDGQSVAIEREPFGKPLDNYEKDGIASTAPYYDGTFVGKWAKGHEKFAFYQIPVGDFNPAFDLTTGTGPAITVTSVIRDVMQNIIGIAPWMLDIPELSIPFASAEAGKDVMIQPKQNQFEYVLHLVRDYLGWALFWDRNAGLEGMWRIKPQVELFGPQSTPLAAFWFGPPQPGQPSVVGGSDFPPPIGGNMQLTTTRFGVDPIAPETYGDGQTWIEHYTDWVEPPQYNYIQVWAPNIAQKLPNGGGPSVCIATAWNPNSFQFDPEATPPDPNPETNPDYIGEMIPIVFWEPQPGTVSKADGGVQGLVDFLAYYYINQLGHAKKHFRLRAPYLLINDPSDSYLTHRRPLRHNDPVLIGGLPAIIRNCNLDDCNAGFEMAWYQGVFQTFPTN